MLQTNISQEQMDAKRNAQRSYALFGQAVVLVVLAAFAILGAYFSYIEGQEARLQTELSNQFKQARFAVGSEQSLVRKFASEPTAETRLAHQKARSAFVAAMDKAVVIDQSSDVISSLLSLHAEYGEAVDTYFNAIDDFDIAKAGRIQKEAMEPAFNRLEIAVVTEALRHHNQSIRHLDQLVATQNWIFITTAIVFLIGLFLIGYFTSVLRRLSSEILEARERERDSLKTFAQRFHSLVQNASDVILICTKDGTVTYQSASATQAWNYSDDALIGQPVTTLMLPDDQQSFSDLWNLVLSEPGSVHKVDLRIQRADRVPRSISLTLNNMLNNDGVFGMVATAQDITDRKLYEEQLRKKAFFDSLTELPNRALFKDRLDQALSRAGRNLSNVAVLFVDIDNFKQVNDSLGHSAGDELIMAAAARLKECCHDGDTVARLGGDEFVILREFLNEPDEAEALAARILERFAEKFTIHGESFAISVSVGVALENRLGSTADNLIRDADIAMYKAKANGKGRYVVFSDVMRLKALDQLELERDLRDAVSRGEMFVQYQPILDMTTGKLAEAEALVRWNHPIRGLISPADFIPVAESSGLIIGLGQWVLEEACKQAALWNATHRQRDPMVIGVNLSPVQFQHPNLISDVKGVLERSGLPGECLKLEITESAIMQDVENTVAILTQLKDLGVKLAVDDFGTGYSSLSYLKQLPVDVLKIDRSFIHGITENKKDIAIVIAVVTLAKTLNLSITAEGIETEAQADLLKSWAVDHGQGYLFSRPLMAAGFESFLKEHARTVQLKVS